LAIKLTRPQVSLVVSAATTSVCVSLDYGKNLYDMRPENLPKMPFVAVFAGFFSVLAAAWSKTSFALTLLRLSVGWMKAVIWFIIITMNAIMGTAMLFMWIKCQPFAKVWDNSLDGWCIDPNKIVTLFQWSAGEFCLSHNNIRGAVCLTNVIRLVRLCGRYPRAVALGHTIWYAPVTKQQGKIGYRPCHEYGCRVSLFVDAGHQYQTC
jgi:hypothetical protein